MKILENISYGTNKNNVLDIYVSEKENSPVFIYFHGGGLEKGSYKYDLETGFPRMLADKGVTVVSAEYRMYPDAKYPDFIEDAADAVLWVIKNIGKYTDFGNIFVGGSSAGAYITQMLCFNKKYFDERGINANDISGFVHDAGQPTTHFNVLRERGFVGNTRRVVADEAAPIYHIDGTHKYPPMQFIVSDHDMANRYEQTVLMLSVLKNYGYDMDTVDFKIMENTTHCSYNREIDENGENRFARVVYDFICNTLVNTD